MHKMHTHVQERALNRREELRPLVKKNAKYNSENKQAPIFLELERSGHTGMLTKTGLSDEVLKD